MKRNRKLKLSDLKKIPIKKVCFLILLLCITSPFINAQTPKTIAGSVSDEVGEAIIGANIIEKGNTTNGTTSDFEGKFSLRVASNATIIISYLGYNTQEIATGNKSNFTITLSDDQLQLDEVVVIGYGSVSKKELTSAVSHVSNKDFLSISNRNPLMQIQGKVAGLTIDNNAAADPNSNPSVQLRGVTSRSASNDPLIVVDGVPGANLSNVNENDIESIDVLKDGAMEQFLDWDGTFKLNLLPYSVPTKTIL
jgi:hypothetical protein